MILNERLNKTIQQAFGEDYLWTASKINDYGICPFKFFASSVLKLASLDEPSEGFTFDKLGSAYHEILEKTYKKLKEQSISLSSETIAEAAVIVGEVGEQVFQEYLETRKVRKSRLWQYETEEIKKDILNLLMVEAETNQENNSAPYIFEKRFGMGSEPPLVIDGDSGKIQIRGIIDRIDETDSGLVVIDYKTSRSVISTREATEGRNLQLPIYLMAANQFIKLEKSVEQGYYLHVRSYKKGSEFPNKNLSLEEISAQTINYINQYSGKVRQAEFPIAPQQTNCYQRCSYHSLCRIQSLKTLETDE
jgi:ATP-dependent helicase/DNAse subunit B